MAAPKNYPNLFIIDNGWVDYFSIESDNLKIECDTDKKSYHGDSTVDLILGVSNQSNEERKSKLDDFGYKIHLVNIYENSYLTGEPKVEKQASLKNVLRNAENGDILLMNMELYRHPYNLPITTDPISLDIVKDLIAKGVKCVFPAGNSCIDLKDKIEKPENYFLVGAKSKVLDKTTKEVKEIIFSSNYCTIGGIIYETLDDEIDKYFGLTQSSAAAAVFVKKMIQSDSSDYDTNCVLTGNISIIPTPDYKGVKFEVTNYMLRKWGKELSNEYKDNSQTTFLSQQLSPINRNLFPYPVKLKLNRQEIVFSRNIEKIILEKIVDEFKANFLALKLCFGIDSNGNILVIVSGYIPKKFDEKIKDEKNPNSFFSVSSDSYLLDYEKEPIMIGEEDDSKKEKIKEILDKTRLSKAKKDYYISEFQRHFKKTITYGLTIGLNVLDNLLTHYYQGNKLRVMIVSDSRNIDSEQEFGILITDGNNEKPICIIKDRVINQADGPTCPPIPPCNQ